jgi:hypothetical protein
MACIAFSLRKLKSAERRRFPLGHDAFSTRIRDNGAVWGSGQLSLAFFAEKSD